MALAPTKGATNGTNEHTKPTTNTLNRLRLLAALASAHVIRRTAAREKYSRPIK